MKSLIVPIAIVIGLILFFIIIDRKEFNHTDNVVQTGQSESSKTDRKASVPVSKTEPATTKPAVETKPNAETNSAADTKSVTEVKPVESSSITERKSATEFEFKAEENETNADDKTVDNTLVSDIETKTEVKPAAESGSVAEVKLADEEKTVGTKPVTETKPVENPSPAAVPVVTAKEAERINEFAIFLSKVKTTIVEGEITERSELPDPQKSDYPNCRFTVHFTGHTIKSGEPCPKELSLIVEGFENYQILSNNYIKKGDKVQCAIIPFELLPEDFQSTQQADDLDLFLLDSYYVLDIKAINNFTDNELMPVSGIYFSNGNNDYVSIFKRNINPPISEKTKKAQEVAIQSDLEKMNQLLEGFDDLKINEINTRFAEAWKREMEKDVSGRNRVGNQVWRKIDNSFWALPIEYTDFLISPRAISEDVLNSFLSIKNACEANGVQLIFSLVPDWHVVSSRVINQEFRNVPDLQTAFYTRQLSQIGIETIYATDLIVQNYNRFPFAFFYPSNNHPGDTTQDCLSDVLSERLKRYDIPKVFDPLLFTSNMESTRIYSDPKPYLFPKECDTGSYEEDAPYECRHIYYDSMPVNRDKNASIMLVGNSFMQTPMYFPDTMPTLIMYKTLSSVDWIRMGGMGPFSDFLIRLLSTPDEYLKDRKVLIMCFGTGHISYICEKGLMLDIGQMDSERSILNNKEMKGHFFIQSNATVDLAENPELWGALSSAEKSVFTIDDSGEMTYCFKSEQFGNGVIESEPITLIVPHICAPRTTCNITVNGIDKPMHSSIYVQNSRFFNLVFELPADTNEVAIKVKGRPGTIFAIKDIQIWQ